MSEKETAAWVLQKLIWVMDLKNQDLIRLITGTLKYWEVDVMSECMSQN